MNIASRAGIAGIAGMDDTFFCELMLLFENNSYICTENIVIPPQNDKIMAAITNEETEKLRQQLEVKRDEIKAICEKLIKGGAKDEIPDDFLDHLLY
jgi:hypothetical protein